MNRIDKIKERISSIIHKEEQQTLAEIVKLKNKQASNMSYYGLGGPYQRYETAISRRKTHLIELDAIKKAQGKSVIMEKLRLYAYYCPTCQEKIYLTYKQPETVNCPICMRTIFRSGLHTEWNIEKDSQFIKLH